jgi:2,5-diketo-D-gluconate reductase A
MAIYQETTSAGVSNFQPEHLDRIMGETGVIPAVNQFELHPYFANTAAVSASRSHGIAVEAHSPLGHNTAPPKDETILAIASERGKSAAPIILRWHMQHGHIAIPKSGNRERMDENIDIFDFELSTQQVAAIDALDQGENGRVGPDPDIYEGI